MLGDEELRRLFILFVNVKEVHDSLTVSICFHKGFLFCNDTIDTCSSDSFFFFWQKSFFQLELVPCWMNKYCMYMKLRNVSHSGHLILLSTFYWLHLNCLGLYVTMELFISFLWYIWLKHFNYIFFFVFKRSCCTKLKR